MSFASLTLMWMSSSVTFKCIKNALSFLSFPYACPEPVLVKRSI